MDEYQITRVLEALFEAFPIEEGAEITCECNPGNAHHALRSGGAQSGRQPALDRRADPSRRISCKSSGRIHNWERVISAVGIARDAGFDNFNLDLMFGLPSQTVADVRETLAAAIALSPTHLSCYGLIVEEGTPICRDVALGKLALPDEEVERDMYELVRQTLAAYDYRQYEISNFAREGFACRHNLGCWTRVPYLGFGCAAHSFFDECRTANPRKLDAYLTGELPQTEHMSQRRSPV